MSNHVNEQILERIVDDVSEMSTSAILQELNGGKMDPGICESWDMRVALSCRETAAEKLVMKRFEEWPEAV